MACACKVNQQLSYLEKKYGVKSPESKKTNIRELVGGKLQTLVLIIIMLPIVPVLLIISIFQSIFSKEKTIYINKIFKIKKDVRN